MTLYFSDAFNRADTASGLGQTTGSGIFDGTPGTAGNAGVGLWSSINGTWGISSNQAYTSASTAISLIRVTLLSTQDDHYDVRVTLSVLPGTNGTEIGLAYRSSGLGASWAGWTCGVINVSGVQTFRVNSVTGGVKTSQYTGGTVSAGDVVRVVNNLNTMDFYQNNVLQTTITDATSAGQGGVGLYSHSNTDGRLDNWSVQSPVSAPLIYGSPKLRPAPFKPGTAR